MDAGKLDRRATFSRRPPGATEFERGDTFEPYLTVWACYVRSKGAEKIEAGRDVDVEAATLVIRDSIAARAVTAADRVTVQGRDFAVASVGLPNRRTGLISLDISSDLG